MDELINDFIEVNYTQELGQELLRALQIFDFFNYKAVFEKVVNLIMDSHNRDKNDVSDGIIDFIREGQEFIFRSHKITVDRESLISTRNELLVGLALFMKLDDYEPIITVLHSQESDMDIFTSIITDLCMLDQVQMYQLIADFDPEILDTMKRYAEGKTTEEDVEDIGRERTSIINTLSAFRALYGDNCLGVNMLNSGTIPGARLDSYYPYIKDILIDANDVKQTALNVLSVLLLSSNGHNAPIITYKKYIDKFTDSLELVQKLEPILLSMLVELDNYKRAKHEQRTVPEASALR